jgi:hypothetical protein
MFMVSLVPTWISASQGTLCWALVDGSMRRFTGKIAQNRVSNRRLTKEQMMNYVLCPFMERNMFRAVVEEAAALTSIVLFLGMIAVWAQVISAL